MIWERRKVKYLLIYWLNDYFILFLNDVHWSIDWIKCALLFRALRLYKYPLIDCLIGCLDKKLDFCADTSQVLDLWLNVLIKCLICIQRLVKNPFIDSLIDCFDKKLDLCAETSQVSANLLLDLWLIALIKCKSPPIYCLIDSWLLW